MDKLELTANTENHNIHDTDINVPDNNELVQLLTEYSYDSDIINMVASLGEDSGPMIYNTMLQNASHNGHLVIVNWLLNTGVVDYNGALVCAAFDGHIAIIERLIEVGATNYNLAMIAAACNNQLGAANLLLRAIRTCKPDDGRWSTHMGRQTAVIQYCSHTVANKQMKDLMATRMI